MDTRLTSAPMRTADEVYAHLIALGAVDPENRPGFLREYVDEAYGLYPDSGVNPEWAITQAALETGDPHTGLPPFISAIYRSRGMVAGMGVTDNFDHGYGFPDGQTAARGQIVHLALYVYGRDRFPDALQPYIDMDPRWDAVLTKKWDGTVATIDDLAGKWATDPAYGSKLRSRFARIIADAPHEVNRPHNEDGGTHMYPGDIYVINIAGHRSTGDPGDPVEREMTDELAVAYTDVFRKAGFVSDWFQRDLDEDNLPTMTKGDLSTVARGVGDEIGDALKKDAKLVIMNDCHYNGRHSPWHIIVADNIGLTSAFGALGSDPYDTAANNTLDVALATIWSQKAAKETGHDLFHGRLGIPGIMSERESGVGLDGWRLGMMAATAPYRMGAIRFIVEHGGTADPETQRADFTQRCARAAVAAVIEGLGIEVKDQEPTQPPHDKPEPSDPIVAYPFGLSQPVAVKLFGQVTGDDQRIYGFNPTGPVSTTWLEHGRRTERFPELVNVFHDNHDDGSWTKYFQFADGTLIVDTNEPGPVVIVGDSAATKITSRAIANALNEAAKTTIDNSK